MSGRIVVVGGDAAGMSAAAEARRADPAREIVVLERGGEVSYAACGIPYWISGEVRSERELIAHPPEYFRERRGIEVRTGVEVRSIDPGRRVVRAAGGEEVAYGALILATGARPALPPVPGVGLDGVLTLRDLADARELRRRLDAAPASASVLLVGAGPIGVELAEALLERGARVEMIELLPRPVPLLASEVAEPVAEALAAACVGVRAGTGLEGVDREGGRLAVVAGGERSEHDLVLLGTGVVPNSELAREAGCALGERAAIAVDRRGRTTVPGIWAAGDCAVAHHRVLQRPVWAPLATTANAQGRVAGRDAAGAPSRFAGVLGSWVSRFRDVSFGATGIDADTAAEAGFRPASIVRDGRDRSGYMPGARPLRVRLVWDADDGRLLGGQAAGGGDVSTRLHTIATAVTAGMTVRDLAECDFGYAPPVSPLRDPVELAAAAAVGDAP